MYSLAQAAKNLEKRKEKTTPSEKKRARIVCGLVSQSGEGSSPGLFVSHEDEDRLRKMTFEELAAAGLVLKVWSEVLGESILLVPDTYTPTAGDPVTYTHEEIKALTKASEDEVRAGHKIKKTFCGRIYQADKEAP